MANQTGKKYICGKCGSEFIVTKGGNGQLSCCGQIMELKKQCTHSNELTRRWFEMNQLGKRFKCEMCNTEVLCTKAGEGSIMCCNKEMGLQQPKALPSSDQKESQIMP